MASIAAIIVALAKVIPAIGTLLNTTIKQWEEYQISQIQDRYEQRQKLRTFLTYQLKNAWTDNERIAAFKLLSSME